MTTAQTQFVKTEGIPSGAAAAPAEPLPRASGKPYSLKTLAMRGAAWTLAGYGASQILRLGSNLVLTRLLAPELFGIMALANVALQGLQMFSDIGIRPSIIRSVRGNDLVFVNVAWTLQVLRGVCLWLACCLLAWPVAAFYGQHLLLYLLPVAGMSALLAGLQSTSLAIANREMRFGRITIVELASQGAGIAVMISWALASRSIWALIAGGIAGAGTRSLLSHLVIPGIPCHFHWDRSCLHELVSFGRWIFLSTALTFFANQGDRLVFGKLLTMDMLGIYSIATMLVLLPQQIFISLSSGVIMPVYSALMRDGRNLSSTYDRVRRPLVMAAAFASAFFVSAGPALIAVLYDPRYAAAGYIIQLLGMAVVIHTLEATNGSVLLAAGQAQGVAAGNAAKFVAMLFFIPVGWMIGNLEGAVIGLVFTECARYATSLFFIRRLGLGSIGADLVVLALAVGTGFAGFLVAWLIPNNAPQIVRLTTIGVMVAVCGMALWMHMSRGRIAPTRWIQ